MGWSFAKTLVSDHWLKTKYWSAKQARALVLNMPNAVMKTILNSLPCSTKEEKNLILSLEESYSFI